MTDHPPGRLEERIRRLENRLRLLQACLGAAVLVIVSVAAWPGPEARAEAADADGVLRARGLVIEDGTGRERILLGAPVPEVAGRIRKDAVNALVFLGADGADRVTVGQATNPQIAGKVVSRIAPAWGLQVHDERGDERGGFGYLENGRVVLGLDFAGGRGEGIALAVVDGRYAAMIVNDETGARERATLYVGKEGPAALKLGGPGGPRVMLQVPGDEEAQLLLFDPSDSSMVDVMPEPPARAAPPAEGVQSFGVLREIMRSGRAPAAVGLAEFLPGDDVYAVGALSGLRGEITVVGGRVSLAYADGDDAVRVESSRRTDEEAALLVVARVPEWRETRTTREIAFADLDRDILELAAGAGVDVQEPFPFVIEGDVTDLRWHVIDGRRLAGAGSQRAHHEAAIGLDAEKARVTIVGFFSREHQGVFTHMGSHTHLHVVVDQPPSSGHVEHVVLPAGTTVRFPRGG